MVNLENRTDLRSSHEDEMVKENIDKLINAVILLENDAANSISQIIELVGVECARGLYTAKYIQYGEDHVRNVLGNSFKEQFYPGE